MKSNAASQDSIRRITINMLILGIFIVLMSSFLYYFSESEADVKKLEMGLLADSFADNVTNSRWQWIAEGKPERIILIQYTLDENQEAKEVDRRPIPMTHLGWPKAAPDQAGCQSLWKIVLDIPMEIKRFRVYAEYYDGLDISGKVLDSRCKFRLSTGPEFEYLIYTGRVIKTNV